MGHKNSKGTVSIENFRDTPPNGSHLLSKTNIIYPIKETIINYFIINTAL